METFEKFCQNNDQNQQSGVDSLNIIKNKKDRHAINLNKKERTGLESLLKRVKNNEIVITPTDKSGRFAVLTAQQYLEAGSVHTSKDDEISWREVKYLRNQVNDHMAWLRGVFKYCDKTDSDRMAANLVVSDLDLPEMTLLTKDHKTWSYESGKAVPTRPVVSGNSTINTHLSEMISEIIEPVALESNGAEIQSSEEALHLIDWYNERNLSGRTDEYNYLDKFEYTMQNSAAGLPLLESVHPRANMNLT